MWRKGDLLWYCLRLNHTVSGGASIINGFRWRLYLLSNRSWWYWCWWASSRDFTIWRIIFGGFLPLFWSQWSHKHIPEIKFRQILIIVLLWWWLFYVWSWGNRFSLGLLFLHFNKNRMASTFDRSNLLSRRRELDSLLIWANVVVQDYWRWWKYWWFQQSNIFISESHLHLLMWNSGINWLN